MTDHQLLALAFLLPLAYLLARVLSTLGKGRDVETQWKMLHWKEESLLEHLTNSTNPYETREILEGMKAIEERDKELRQDYKSIQLELSYRFILLVLATLANATLYTGHLI